MPVTIYPISNGTNLFTDEALLLQCRLDRPDDQSLLQMYASAAIDYAETAMGTTLLSRSRTAKFFGDNPKMYLPNGPIISITSVTDANNKAITYRLESYGHADLLVPLTSFVAPVTVVYVAGYPTADDVPASIRAAILAHVGTLYSVRESVTDKAMIPVPHTLDAFYARKSRLTGIG